MKKVDNKGFKAIGPQIDICCSMPNSLRILNTWSIQTYSPIPNATCHMNLLCVLTKGSLWGEGFLKMLDFPLGLMAFRLWKTLPSLPPPVLNEPYFHIQDPTQYWRFVSQTKRILVWEWLRFDATSFIHTLNPSKP